LPAAEAVLKATEAVLPLMLLPGPATVIALRSTLFPLITTEEALPSPVFLLPATNDLLLATTFPLPATGGMSFNGDFSFLLPKEKKSRTSWPMKLNKDQLLTQ
jgi:hypothetical protein